MPIGLTNLARRQVRQPAYLSRFRCIGPACEDTCCGAWQVSVDAATQAKLLAVQEASWRVKLDALIEPRNGQAVIRTNAVTGCCALLGEDCLCALQQQFGAGYLPDICFHYPRATWRTQGGLERAATLSCPEVARLALLDEGAMEQMVVTEPAESRTLAHGLANPAAATVRGEVLSLLRNDAVAMDTRLVAIAWALGAISDSAPPSHVRAAFKVAGDGLRRLERETAALARDRVAQIEMLRQLLTDRMGEGSALARFRSCARRTGSALGLYNEAAATQRAAQAYEAAAERWYRPYLERRPWLLRNAAINDVLSSTFPFRAGTSMADEALLLAARYALTRLLLVGVGAHEQSLTDELAVQVIQSLHRALDHSPSAAGSMLEIMRQAKLDDQPRLVNLILT